MRDQVDHIHPLVAIAPTSVADNTVTTSGLINTQGFDALSFVVQTGAISDVDATFAVTATHGDAADGSDQAAVPANMLIGQALPTAAVQPAVGTLAQGNALALAGFQHGDGGKTRKFGYSGDKQYVKVSVTPTANGSAAFFSVLAVLGHPSIGPTPNPPVA